MPNKNNMAKGVLYRFKRILTKEAGIPKEFINKFTISSMIFLVWITFFDNHNLIDRYKVSSNLNKMEAELASYKEMIAVAKRDRAEFEKNKEKYAREKYYMHRADEEVFIIEKK